MVHFNLFCLICNNLIFPQRAQDLLLKGLFTINILRILQILCDKLIKSSCSGVDKERFFFFFLIRSSYSEVFSRKAAKFAKFQSTKKRCHYDFL